MTPPDSRRSPPPAPEGAGAYPGARHPQRTTVLKSSGVDLRVVEWGCADDPPLLLAHGGADFAQTLDVFGPLLAAGGWRVISWDHRGHGDSGRAAMYSWDADVRDALAVLDYASRGASAKRLPVVGHSKGGGLFSHLCAALPGRFRSFVNIDGVPSTKNRFRSDGLSLEERVRGRDDLWKRYLTARRRAATATRRPGTLVELAERRARMNPRLAPEWLQYLVTVGADRTAQDRDEWRWKLDPAIQMGGVGPWRPSWGLRGLGAIEVPMLVILGEQQEPMGWGTTPEGVRDVLPREARLESFDDSGHFVHIEHPERTAQLVLDFVQ